MRLGTQRLVGGREAGERQIVPQSAQRKISRLPLGTRS